MGLYSDFYMLISIVINWNNSDSYILTLEDWYNIKTMTSLGVMSTILISSKRLIILKCNNSLAKLVKVYQLPLKNEWWQL